MTNKAVLIFSLCATVLQASAFYLVMHGSSQPRRPPPKAKPLGRYSKSIPFLERSPALDGTYAGDVGFDPMNMAKDEYLLLSYREAEIKHARLAMLAAAGWPLSEMWDAKIASFLNLPPLLDEDGRVPSLLNGGLGKVPMAYWNACLLLAAAIDMYGLSKVNEAGYVPGNLGLDPFGLTEPKKDKGLYNWMALAEIKNGRLAMLAVTAYAILEFVQHKSIVSSYDYLFQPLEDTVKEYKAVKGIKF